MKRESDIERIVTRWADRRGLMHLKLNIWGNRGFQDQLFFIPGGRPFLLELKRLGERPGRLQMYRKKQLKARGYDVGWTDSADEAIGWLKQRCS
jgi:hypothetical protein